MIQDLIFPTIYCPFPSAINSHVDALQQHTLDWVQQFKLISNDIDWHHLKKSQFHRLAARAYPNTSLDRLAIIADWNIWLFILDDQCDEWGFGKHPEQLAILHNRCLEILSGAMPNIEDVALVHAIYNIRTRIEKLMPLSWVIRFIQSVAEYFEAIKWEAENRQKDIWPDVETYIRMRPYTGGLLTDIDLIELSESIFFPLVIRKHPCICELIEITNNVVCWSNDIISLPKENKHHDRHNLVLIFRHYQAINLQTAIEQVNQMIENAVYRFIELEQSLSHSETKNNEDVSRLIGIMRSWMRGNLDWSLESERYNVSC
ncbi:MAG: hypothetical protein LUP96_02130 [Methylococcaceae bacterium]|nr:hypothetical protein [Methylococcaceae bacterium]MDD1626632.1 hypothetical protein [Methylococcaceae bacterium]